MGVLREELRHNLLNAGAVLVGFAKLKECKNLPFPALPRAVSFAVKLEKEEGASLDDAYAAAGSRCELLAEHAKACLRRYGFTGEMMPAAFISEESPRAEFPDQTAAIDAGLAEKGEDGLLHTGEFGHNVRFCTVFTNATWKKTE